MGRKVTEVDALRESLNVVFERMTYHKIMHWIMKAGHQECSGVGKIVKEGSKLRVVDAIMLPQENSAGGTDIEPEDLGRAEYQLKDTEGDLRFWWHSHVKMDTFWSHTDITTLELLGRHGYYVATVLNQHWHRRSAIYFGNGIDLFVDNLPTSHTFQMPEVVSKPWDEEFKKNVKERVWTPTVYPGSTTSYMNDAVQRFKDWRERLTKRERKLINRQPNDEKMVIAIFDTKTYGRVLWTQADEKVWKKYLTPIDKPAVQIAVSRSDLLKDITQVRYANKAIVEALVFHGTRDWCVNPVLREFAENIETKGRPKSAIVIPDEDEVKKKPLLLPNLLAQKEETELALRRIYPDWDRKTEDEKEEYRVLWESGHWPWENGGVSPGVD